MTGRERVRRLLPFGVASVVAFPLTYLPPEQPRPGFLVAAGVCMLLAAVAVVVLPWELLPVALRLVPAAIYLAGVALLRHADGGGDSGYGPLVLVPLFWTALYGTRGQLWAASGAIAATFVLPALFLGPPAYGASEYKQAAVWLIVAPIVGATVQQLMRRIRAANAELAAAARTDPLTGVANRRAWDAEVARQFRIADRDDMPVAVGLLDLDRFKRFNDERGHQAGDELLRRTAQAWQRLLRPRDLVARWGGEEFAVLLPGVSTDDAVSIVQRLRDAVPEGQTASAGLVFRRPGEDPDDVVRRADTLLYAAKAAGRDRTAVDGPAGP